MTNPIDVTVRVDPACPWAWLTWCWLAEVERVRPVRLTTSLFDLAEVNRGAEADERRLRAHQASETALRALVAARRAGGDAALAALYREIGEAHHEGSDALDDARMLTRALSAAGLDPALTATLSDPSLQAELLREHREAVESGAFGVPTLVVAGAPPTFGPILDARITGEDAGELWDRVSWLVSADRFFELKRPRTRRPDVGHHRVAAA